MFNELRISLDKNKYSGINLYFQDESRFGLMTHVGKYLTARGVKPIVSNINMLLKTPICTVVIHL